MNFKKDSGSGHLKEARGIWREGGAGIPRAERGAQPCGCTLPQRTLCLPGLWVLAANAHAWGYCSAHTLVTEKDASSDGTRTGGCRPCYSQTPFIRAHGVGGIKGRNRGGVEDRQVLVGRSQCTPWACGSQQRSRFRRAPGAR